MLEWLRSGKQEIQQTDIRNRADDPAGSRTWADDPAGRSGARMDAPAGRSGSRAGITNAADAGHATQALADLATEAWRFGKVAMRSAEEMDVMDADRFLNQYDWFARKIQAVMEEAGLWTVDLTGQLYEPGMAVTPLNLEDFPEGTPLVIVQMVEPVLMENGKVRKMGTAMLDFRPAEE